SKGDIISSIQLDPFENPYSSENDVPKKRKSENSGIIDQSTADSGFTFDSLPLDSLDKTKDALEASFVQRALKQAQGNQREAAKLMKITYDQFRGLYRKHSKPQPLV
ncbi:MAG: hypothetical protein J6U27_08010, partial [Spirochaetales bacterium]|nr:hypothetical protein [Spirochaetales bacterium]